MTDYKKITDVNDPLIAKYTKFNGVDLKLIYKTGTFKDDEYYIYINNIFANIKNIIINDEPIDNKKLFDEYSYLYSDSELQQYYIINHGYTYIRFIENPTIHICKLCIDKNVESLLYINFDNLDENVNDILYKYAIEKYDTAIKYLPRNIIHKYYHIHFNKYKSSFMSLITHDQIKSLVKDALNKNIYTNDISDKIDNIKTMIDTIQTDLS